MNLSKAIFLMLLSLFFTDCNSATNASNSPSDSSRFFKQDARESHGGDAISLFFVKTARTLEHAMAKNPQFKWPQEMNSIELAQAIDSTIVEVKDWTMPNSRMGLHTENGSTFPSTWECAQHDEVNGRHRILLIPSCIAAKYEPPLSCWRFQGFVFEQYAKALGHNITVPLEYFASFNINCLNEGGQKLSTLKDPFRVQELFLADSKKLLRLIKKNPQWDISKKINASLFSATINRAKISIASTPLTLKNRPKDAMNSEGIIFDEAWADWPEGQRMEFIVHETLPAMGIDDSTYATSSLLFLNLPEIYYLIY